MSEPSTADAAAPHPASLASVLRRSDTRRFWLQGLIRLSLLLALGALIGAFFDAPWLGAGLTLLALLLAQMRNLIHLRAWLARPKHHELPEPGGLWGEVFDLLLDLQRKNRKKKKKLAAIVSEFQSSTAALPDGAVVLGERGEIAWFNTAARTLLGLRSPQDIGIRIPNLIRHPDFTAYFDAGDFELEVTVSSPINRSKTLSLRVIPYGHQQKLLIVRDVSERLQLEAARRDFVSNASHELRTPLTVLRGYLDMMEMDAQGQGVLSPWKTPLSEMRNQALRMETLINDMLKLARLEADSSQMPEALQDVPRLAAQVLEEAKALSKGQHRFELQLESRLGVVGGETELHSIFTNLVINAVRYTPAGGAIRVRWRDDAEGAHFAVSDTGIGIAPKDLLRLTERFYRVDVGRSRASGGTGLGLSIVKHALEAFDGRLEIDSEVGVGSTFTCHFPRHRLQPLEPHQAGTSPQAD